MRLDKFLSGALQIPRSAARSLAGSGRVTVDGQVCRKADTPVPEGAAVALDGAPLTREEHVYLMLNKPDGVVSASEDGRDTTVVDLVRSAYPRRELFPAGRLDKTSTGFVLLTDDGELTNRVVHPRHHMPRVYHVLIRGGVSDRALEVMRKGMTLAEGEKLAPVEIRVLPGQVHDLSGVSRNAGPPAGQRGTLLEMTLHQGLNRQIRRMCRDLHLTILRLVRVAQGPLRLGVMKPGEARELTPAEVTALKKAVGI